MKKTIVINLYAGPGAGKSTYAAYIFSKLKQHGFNAELVTEFAKDLVWEERHKTLLDEVYLFGKQQHKFNRLKGKVDVIVTDSPLLLKLLYMGNAPKSLKPLVLDVYKEYDNIDVFIERRKKYEPRGRVQTESEARKKDAEILNIIKEHSTHGCLSVVGNGYGVDTFMRFVEDLINSKLKEEISE